MSLYQPVQDHAAVDAYKVAFFESALARYAVHHLFVEGDAQGGRVAAVSFERGQGAVAADEFFCEFVHIAVNCARHDAFDDFLHGARQQVSGGAHFVKFFGGFDCYLADDALLPV